MFDKRRITPLTGLVLVVAAFAVPAGAADDACKPFIDATRKMLVTPVHMYSVTTRSIGKNKTQDAETVYTGGLTGAIYVMVNGKWTRSRMTPADMLKQEDENIRTTKVGCRYLRDEPVNGEPAAVYATHSDNGDDKVDVTGWISKSRGLPLREEMDTDVGGAMGKTHVSIRFDYSNVRPPDGVR